MKIKLALFLLLASFSTFTPAEPLIDLSTEQLIALQKNKNALVIDIRTDKEWAATGTIPDSHKLQFFSAEGKYDAEKWLSELENLKTSSDQPIILVCRSGRRSGMVGTMLSKQRNMKNIHHLSNGISSWIKAGNEVKKDCSNQLACR